MEAPIRFKAVPVEVEAMRWTGENLLQLTQWSEQGDVWSAEDGMIKIWTAEGAMTAEVGDWIIREPYPTDDRLFYPCKHSIFVERYEPVLPADEAIESFRKEYGEADFDTFFAWLLQKSTQGWPQALLLKMAVVSINALFKAATRWQRLEGGRSPSAPIWLDTVERDALLSATSGQKGSTVRLVRSALREMLP